MAKLQIEALCSQTMAYLTAFSSIAPGAVRYLAKFHYLWVDFAINLMGEVLAQEIAAWPAQAMNVRDDMEPLLTISISVPRFSGSYIRFAMPPN